MESRTLFFDDFSDFSIGPYPYDPEHSAMGEYHFAPNSGYTGQWYDPIVNYNYRDYSWLITTPSMDGRKVLEQMRICNEETIKEASILVAGAEDWENCVFRTELRPMTEDLPCGVLFRYQTSLVHYGCFLVPGGIEIIRRNKTERIVLARVDCKWSCHEYQQLDVDMRGSHFRIFLNGAVVHEFEDSVLASGSIALSASMPTWYRLVSVSCSKADADLLEVKRTAREDILKEKRSRQPAMTLLKKIDLKDFGAGRQIRFGHLTGTEELFAIICQPQKRVFKDRYPFISCITAFSMVSGEVLWQIGTPRDDDDVVKLTTDLPFQIYDIDQDGIDEVITSWDFKIMILDGRTGAVKSEVPTPRNIENTKELCGIDFGRHPFDRLSVDAVRIVNVSGKDYPSDIMIKDRYARLWLYDNNLKPLWKFTYGNTGHFPYAYDFDGDGKDEIFSCYNMIDSNGCLKWSLPITTDHTDEIIIGPLDPEHPDETRIAIVSGWEGFMILNSDGDILFRDINGHGQRISCGCYRHGEPGVQICTTTFWINQGIIYLYDGKGNLIWQKEPRCNGNLISPVNWAGNGQDLILLNANPRMGGLMDGDGDVVLSFPDDGHPELCAEVFDYSGNGRDDLIVWDRKALWIYTASDSDKEQVQSDTPRKYQVYNASNYRGEFSFRDN